MATFSTPMDISQSIKTLDILKSPINKEQKREKRESKRKPQKSFIVSITLKRGIYCKRVSWFWESIYEETNKEEAQSMRSKLQREKRSTSSIESIINLEIQLLELNMVLSTLFIIVIFGQIRDFYNLYLNSLSLDLVRGLAQLGGWAMVHCDP